jgi:hypothetical protein
VSYLLSRGADPAIAGQHGNAIDVIEETGNNPAMLSLISGRVRSGTRSTPQTPTTPTKDAPPLRRPPTLSSPIATSSTVNSPASFYTSVTGAYSSYSSLPIDPEQYNALANALEDVDDNGSNSVFNFQFQGNLPNIPGYNHPRIQG